MVLYQMWIRYMMEGLAKCESQGNNPVIGSELLNVTHFEDWSYI